MVEAEPAADQIQDRVDMLRTAGERITNLVGGLLVEMLKLRLTGEHRVD